MPKATAWWKIWWMMPHGPRSRSWKTLSGVQKSIGMWSCVCFERHLTVLSRREYAEEEDARRQKIAQEVIEGKYKGKRRDGLDGELSSDEEDDEDKRKARKKWRKEQERRARELKSNLAQLGE